MSAAASRGVGEKFREKLPEDWLYWRARASWERERISSLRKTLRR